MNDIETDSKGISARAAKNAWWTKGAWKSLAHAGFVIVISKEMTSKDVRKNIFPSFALHKRKGHSMQTTKRFQRAYCYENSTYKPQSDARQPRDRHRLMPGSRIQISNPLTDANGKCLGLEGFKEQRLRTNHPRRRRGRIKVASTPLNEEE